MFRALDTETRTKTSRDGIFTMEYFKIVLLNWSHDFFVNFVDSYPPQGATHMFLFDFLLPIGLKQGLIQETLNCAPQ